jgi:hypothetical protein
VRQTIIVVSLLFVIAPACNRQQDRRPSNESAQFGPTPAQPPAAESRFARLPPASVVVEQTVRRPSGLVTWVYGHISDDKSTPIKLTLSCSLPAPDGKCAELKPGEIYRVEFLSDRDEEAYPRASYTLGSLIASGAAGKHLVFYIVDEAAVHSAAAREREEQAAVKRSSK